MKSNRKKLSIAIIVLIVGAGVVPSISGISENIENDTTENSIIESDINDVITTVDIESSDESGPVDEPLDVTSDIVIDEVSSSTESVFEKIRSRRGLIAYWNFNEGSGDIAYDVSGNGNHALIEGAEWVYGKSKTALEITGTDIVCCIPKNFDDSIDDSLTITSWIYYYGNKPGEGGMIFDARDGTHGFTLTIVDGYLQFYLFLPQGQYQSVTSDDRIPVDRWTHVAAVLNYHTRKPYLQVFINGKENANTLAFGPYFDSHDSAAIGNNHWAPRDGEWATFNGIIDELCIYNRALRKNDVRVLCDNHLDDDDEENEINMSKNRFLNFNLLEWLLERFPNIGHRIRQYL